MKAYFIFAIALTVAYIIYYAAMIARDLYGKNGEKIKSGEEEFDVSDFDEEESVSVVENDKGFNIGDNEYETHYIDETQSVSEETNSADEKPKQDVIEALNNKVKVTVMTTLFANLVRRIYPISSSLSRNALTVALCQCHSTARSEMVT